MNPNPFAVLGLPERPDLNDETVRAAWRAIAADTHPDRADGGDLDRYTQASAAFAELNTPWGRSEAYADLVERARREGRFDDDDDEPGTAPSPPRPRSGSTRSRPRSWYSPWSGSRQESAAAARCACSPAPPSPPGCRWRCWP
jgi:curved DNA-binding protein CbpA